MPCLKNVQIIWNLGLIHISRCMNRISLRVCKIQKLMKKHTFSAPSNPEHTYEVELIREGPVRSCFEALARSCYKALVSFMLYSIVATWIHKFNFAVTCRTALVSCPAEQFPFRSEDFSWELKTKFDKTKYTFTE